MTTIRRGLTVGSVLVLLLLLYLPSLHFPFHFDDHIFLRDDNVRLGRWAAFLWPPIPRSLTWLTFSTQYMLWGDNPAPFRLFNIILHAFNSLLLYMLMIRLATRQEGSRCLARWGMPLTAALLFALHPLQTESVVYIYQRSTLLAGLFSLLALYLWAGRTAQESLVSRRTLGTLVCFFLAVLSKEQALVLPLALWALDFYRIGRRKPHALVLALFAVSLASAASVIESSPNTGSLTGLPLRSLTYAVHQVEVFWKYVRLFLYPVGQSVDPFVKPLSGGWLAAGWWLKLGGILILLSVIPMALRRIRPLSFWLLFSFLWLLPTSSFIPSQDLMFEHRLYLPLIGMAGLCAYGISGLAPSPGRLVILLVFICLPLAWLTEERIAIWRTPTTLWADAAAKAPEKYRPVFNFGVTLMQSNPALAEQFLRRAIEIAPQLAPAYQSLGQLKWLQGDLDSALELWRAALVRAPEDRSTLLALGRLHLRQNDFFQSRDYLQRSLKNEPTDWEARLLLGELFYRFGMTQQAQAQAEEGLRFHPRQPALKVLLADCTRRQANWDRAIELYQSALLEWPKNSRAFLGLAECYFRKGDLKRAQETASQALETALDEQDRSNARGLLQQLAAFPHEEGRKRELTEP